MAADWSQLPAELLEIISTKIIFITDYLRFRAVCTSWRSASPARPRHLPAQLPWLLLPYYPSPDNTDARRLFFDLRDRRIYQLDLPETRGKRVCGSSHGWLVLERHVAISLLNPVTRAHIQLPSLNTSSTFLYFFRPGEAHLFPPPDADQMLEKCSIKNVTLSSNPALNSDCIVLAVFQREGIFAFCRIRDESWTIISESYFFFNDKNIDVTYHNGRFYSVSAHGQVTVYDVNSPRRIVLPSRLQYSWDQKYLVDQSSQELLMVEWNFESRSANGGAKYDVFKLDVDGQPKWVKVEDIGNSMLFLGGTNRCFCLPAVNFDGWGGNFIYHTVPYFLQRYEDGDLVSHAVNSFSLKDDCTMQIACNLGVSLLHWSPPMWVTPSLF
uniref:F-box protein At2g17036 n=1 Tax=Elaeis guineensis var. tenera TaxID=51953 RepID=A0A6I9QLM6_ELAGV|nr:F-box protein At2g17036 [Elaeis guineensis]